MSALAYVAARPALLPYLTDQPLCRWVLARHARTRGNRFFHLELPL